MSNHYETLKLQPNATEQQIKKAIQDETARLVMEFDATSTAAKKAIAEAAAVLLDTAKKQAYDAQLQLSSQAPAVTQLPIPTGPASDKAADDITKKFNEYLKGLGFKNSDEAEKAGYKNLGLHTDKNGQKCMVLQFPSREAADDFINKMGLQGKAKIIAENEFKSSGLTPISGGKPVNDDSTRPRM